MGSGKTTRRKLLKTALLAAGAGALAMGSQWGEVDRLTLEKHQILLDDWPGEPLRVAFLTDLHLVLPEDVDRANRALDMALQHQPSLILYGGDYVTQPHSVHLDQLDRYLARASEFEVPMAGVLGNHDFGTDPEAVRRVLRAHRFELLENDVLEWNGVQVVGLADAVGAFPDYELPSRLSKKRPRLVLLHEPDYTLGIGPHGSLCLSGHSHGGQVCLPFGLPLRLPRGARKHYRGLYTEPETPIYVSRGIGATSMNVRMFCPPEVTILDLGGKDHA